MKTSSSDGMSKNQKLQLILQNKQQEKLVKKWLVGNQNGKISNKK